MVSFGLFSGEALYGRLDNGCPRDPGGSHLHIIYHRVLDSCIASPEDWHNRSSIVPSRPRCNAAHSGSSNAVMPSISMDMEDI